jgi:hypothetical protein
MDMLRTPFFFLENKLLKLKPLFRVLLCQTPPIATLALVPFFDVSHVCAGSLGIGMGILLNHV